MRRAETRGAGRRARPVADARVDAIPRPHTRRSSISTPRWRAGPRCCSSTNWRIQQRGGSRHPKRWQDVEELLAAGIDVWSTINVQHLESLNDVVNGITGIRVLRDGARPGLRRGRRSRRSSTCRPTTCCKRLEGRQGLPAAAGRARGAATSFARATCIALRELALRRTADRVDDEMLQLSKRTLGRQRRSGRPASRYCWPASARCDEQLREN